MSLTNLFRGYTIALLLAATVLCQASAQNKPAGTSAALETRVQRLEDLEEIRTVLTNYGRFLDARDFASYSQLFAKDGEWIGGLGKVQGPAAIQAFMEKSIGVANSAHNYHLSPAIELRYRRSWGHRHRMVAMGLRRSRPGQEARDRSRRPL